jgi:rare lipoprotein A
MMTKYFATAFVAVSTLLGAASHGAFARSPSRSVEAPAPNAPAPNAPAPNAPTPNAWVGEIGKASYYGPHYHGRRAASGAHPWLPFGTKVKVILAGTGRSVIVTITDRLYSSRRVVDLSVAAARELGMIHRGVAEVVLTPV